MLRFLYQSNIVIKLNVMIITRILGFKRNCQQRFFKLMDLKRKLIIEKKLQTFNFQFANGFTKIIRINKKVRHQVKRLFKIQIVKRYTID